MADGDMFIVDEPLPEALDGEALRNNGIQMLQALVGQVWTNYNESDPGVTILDQLCFALTELGYCAQFPIEDVLTRENGKIGYRDQFFEPQNILTCSPITPDDYRKLILDAVPEVRVIYIWPEKVSSGNSGRYISYLGLDEKGGQSTEDEVIRRVHVLLNQNRNLGEWFLQPKKLRDKGIGLTGKVTLAQSADARKVRAGIMSALLEYAAPRAMRAGYGELVAMGLESDRIFNGPKLRHGWIAGKGALRQKGQSVSLCELNTILAKVEGVMSVDALAMVPHESHPDEAAAENPYKGPEEVPLEEDEIAKFSLLSCFLLMRNGEVLATRESGDAAGLASAVRSQYRYLADLHTSHQAASVPSRVDLYPPLPEGKYRNIEEYYSVQNTFPDIYGIGRYGLSSDAPENRVARSRQLKGYLMAFDQLLANQFSQLAHIDELFSFGCGGSGYASFSPPDIPHDKFVTTYYSQPLYDVPDVKPLLLGNDAFLYGFDPYLPERQQEEQAWKKFRDFPFNEYIYGLRQCTESETEAVFRRDAMLAHLMARHGEDAALYDDMIDKCQWYGGKLKTRIVVKNIWMQNYELLSYHRSRAYDVYSAVKLPFPGEAVQGDAPSPGALGAPSLAGTTMRAAGKEHALGLKPGYPLVDGELDQARIYAGSRLTKTDLENFSAFELKMGILLDLPTRLYDLSGSLRKLLEDPDFGEWLRTAQNKGKYALPDSDICVERESDKDKLYEGGQSLMEVAARTPEGYPDAYDYQARAEQLHWLASYTKGFLLIESVLVDEILVGENWDAETITAPLSPLSCFLLFPDYVTLFQQAEFDQYIDALKIHHWPAHLTMHYTKLPYLELQAVILAYVVARNDKFEGGESVEQE